MGGFYVAGIGEMKNACTVWSGNVKRRNNLGHLTIDGRIL